MSYHIVLHDISLQYNSILLNRKKIGNVCPIYVCPGFVTGLCGVYVGGCILVCVCVCVCVWVHSPCSPYGTGSKHSLPWQV